jgi:hypothetical protein
LNVCAQPGCGRLCWSGDAYDYFCGKVAAKLMDRNAPGPVERSRAEPRVLESCRGTTTRGKACRSRGVNGLCKTHAEQAA